MRVKGDQVQDGARTLCIACQRNENEEQRVPQNHEHEDDLPACAEVISIQPPGWKANTSSEAEMMRQPKMRSRRRERTTREALELCAAPLLSTGNFL